MSGILGRARNLFGKRPETPSVEPFSIRCVCGAKLEGLRRTEAQTLECESCGAAVFVLPKSPLAPPGPTKHSRSSKKRRGASRHRVVEQFTKQEALDFDGSKSSESPAETPPRTRPWIMERRFVKPIEEDEEKPPAPPIISKRRLITIGVATAFLLGIFLVYRQIDYRNLKDQLPERARRGLQLLAEGAFLEAREPLRLSVRALDAGIPYGNADEVRQAYVESSVLGDLLDEPLETAVDSSSSDESSFARRFAHKSILLDLEVERDHDGTWIQHFSLPTTKGVFRLSPQGVNLYSQLNLKNRTRILMGVRLLSMRKEGEGWIISVDPNNAVLLTSVAALKKLGLDQDPEAEKILARQREWILGTSS